MKIKRHICFIPRPPFLICLCLSAALSISCVKNASAIEKRCNFAGDGHISIYNYHLDESLDSTYKTNGVYNQAALEEIYRILRSPDGKIHPVDTKIIDIIDNIQDHFGARTIEVISGFRSGAYNKGLKERGRRVARESLHMEGGAIDIHIDEVREEVLYEYAKGLSCGGVGLYPDSDFVHIDTGPRRTWSNASEGRKLVGIDNNKSTHSITTDKNDYLRGEKIVLKIINGSTRPITIDDCSAIEIFERGKWKKMGELNLACKKKIINPAGSHKLIIDTNPRLCSSKNNFEPHFGRFRLRLRSYSDRETTETLSNEFYFKKY